MSSWTRRRFTVSAFMSGLALPALAQDGDRFFREFEKRIDKRYQDAVDRTDREFARVEAIADAALTAADQDVRSHWGSRTALSTRTRWAGYSPDRRFRLLVDYRQGSVTFQTNQQISLGDARRQLAVFLEASSRDLDRCDPVMQWNRQLADEAFGPGYESSIPQEDFEAVDAELAGIIDIDENPITFADWHRIEDGLETKLPLSEEWQQVHVERFLPLIADNAGRFGLEPSLLLALIAEGSGFNPRACQQGEGYGLLQLRSDEPVQKAWRSLGYHAVAPLPPDLIDPAINLTLGSAALQLLQQDYLSDIRDGDIRQFAMLAAQRHGLDSFPRLFGPHSQLNDAISYLNQMSPDDAFQRLSEPLPGHGRQSDLSRIYAARDRFAIYDDGK